ncbi:MAG: zinc-finger domain-containing protein [Neisseriaceae bacterium]|nr:zinc-finger domain-containing protein [Neisseriaceae bacterium]
MIMTTNTITITEHDLPLVCPRSNQASASHPSVTLPILKQGGTARCPYCGTNYVYTGKPPIGHH